VPWINPVHPVKARIGHFRLSAKREKEISKSLQVLEQRVFFAQTGLHFARMRTKIMEIDQPGVATNS
jgi:hypothetical protein